MSFPFYYSRLNYDIVHGDASGSMNIFWNQLREKASADSILYMTPTFNPSIGFEYPLYWQYGDNLINPLLAVQQTMQNWMNNNSWMNNGWMNNNWMNNNNLAFPWNNNNSNNNSSSTSQNPEYDALKALITKYRDLGTSNNTLAPNLLKEINAALNKSGTNEEKLAALKDVYKEISKKYPAKLENALLELPEYKDVLVKAGYKFNGTYKDEDKKLRDDLNKSECDLNSTGVSKLFTSVANDRDPQILRTLSYWNDERNTDENRGIIRAIANHLPTGSDSIVGQQQAVKNIAMSLVSKAEDIKAEFSESMPNLKTAVKSVKDALTEATNDKSFTKENLMTLAEKCDKLYAMLRLLEAQKINNEIRTKYGFINGISNEDTDFVDDDLVIKATKEDLKAEGIDDVDDLDIDDIRAEVEDVEDDDDDDGGRAAGSNPEKTIQNLVDNGQLEQVAGHGEYYTSSTGEPAKYYTIEDGKIVELKDVKEIGTDGKCTMRDGSKLDLNFVDKVETSASAIKKYNKTLINIKTYISNGKLVEWSGTQAQKTTLEQNWPKGIKLYKSKDGKDENGRAIWYVVRNNELQRIKYPVNADGLIVKNGGNVKYGDLVDGDFETVSDIETKDLQEEKKKAEKDEKEKKYGKELGDTPHEDDKGKGIGKDLHSYLCGSTDKGEWNAAKLKIKDINKNNVYSVIKEYTDDIWTTLWFDDKLILQIATEGDRDKGEKVELINHIIESVLGYCKEYGSASPSAFEELDTKYKSIKESDFDNKNDMKAKMKEIDNCILQALGLD